MSIGKHIKEHEQLGISNDAALNFNPLTLPGLVAALEADGPQNAGTHNEGDMVHTFYDRSGNENHALSRAAFANDIAFAGREPKYHASGGPNNLPYLEFNPDAVTNSALFLDIAALTTTATIYTVFKPSLVNGHVVYFFLDGSKMYYSTTGAPRITVSKGSEYLQNYAVGDGWMLNVTVINGANSKNECEFGITHNDNIGFNVDGTITSTDLSEMTIGMLARYTTGTDLLLHALYIQSGAATQLDIQAMKDMLAKKCGISQHKPENVISPEYDISGITLSSTPWERASRITFSSNLHDTPYGLQKRCEFVNTLVSPSQYVRQNLKVINPSKREANTVYTMSAAIKVVSKGTDGLLPALYFHGAGDYVGALEAIYLDEAGAAISPSGSATIKAFGSKPIAGWAGWYRVWATTTSDTVTTGSYSFLVAFVKEGTENIDLTGVVTVADASFLIDSMRLEKGYASS